MGFSHLALAVKDIEATHRFYTEWMGFELVKVEVVPKNGGFARHAFYSTGPARDQLMAFWDLSNVPMESEFRTDIGRGLGLEAGINHFAFTADDVDDLLRKRDRWLQGGYDVLEIDHGWIHSIYTQDPDRNTVEFAVMTRDLTADESREGLELLRASKPRVDTSDKAKIELHKASAPL